MRKRRLIGMALAVAAGVGIWKRDAIVDKVLDLRYGQTLPAARLPVPTSSAEARLQDLGYLAQLPQVDRSFSPDGRKAFAERVAALKARVASLTDVQFFLGVAEAVAQARNAHTGVEMGAMRSHFNSAPVRMAWFPEGLHVVRATVANHGLLGARIVAIDGLDPEMLANEAARFFGGTPEYARAMNTLVLESPEALQALHPEVPGDRVVLQVMDQQGKSRSVELSAVIPTAAPAASKPGRILSPVRLPSESPGGWTALLDPARGLPLSLREPDRSAFAARVGEGALYLHLWQIRDDAHGPLAAAIIAAAGPPTEAPWRHIVLDLRFDAGGDYPVIYRALEALRQRLGADGKVSILVDNTTFSAAIIVAALMKHFAAGRATIVGEKPGDRLAFWAEGGAIELPNSKIKVNFSTGFHDWAHGCREPRCWWPNLFYDVAAGSVDPDVVVTWRFEDYRRGVDTVLARARQ
jgi:hypothetical protein